jgi:hypothetical protein
MSGLFLFKKFIKREELLWVIYPDQIQMMQLAQQIVQGVLSL